MIMPDNSVTIGSKVRLKLNGRVRELQIVGSAEVDASIGKISYLSPIGEAVLGRCAGDQICVRLPDGKKIFGEITSIK